MEKDEVSLVVGINPKDVVQSGVDTFSDGLRKYLSFLQLPVENVLVNQEERVVVINNLPQIVNRLSTQQREEAMYISKFIAACGAGLFDAALNFLWNETVVNLRQKVVRFDLNYFLDSVVTDSKRRTDFRNEDDLPKLEDWELIKGCKETGILTELGYKHLDYIRTMRNHASAAHPNHNDLDGLQLSSWLQTCIREVLAKEPEGPVIEVRKLLNNLRCNQLTIEDVPPIAANIQQLPVQLVDSTLRAIFGMYTDSQLAANVRTNLILVASTIWNCASQQARYNAGLKYAVFSANAEIDRRNYARDFLTSVNGLSFLPNDSKAIEMDQVLDNLYSAHMGWNNFHNEPPHAKALFQYIGDTGEVPKEILSKYVKILIMCFVGNGYGVSTASFPIYEELIGRFSDKHYLSFVQSLNEADIQSRLSIGGCAEEFQCLANSFYERAVNIPLKHILQSVSKASIGQLLKLANDTRFRKQLLDIIVK